jgi:hypothetical protein
MTLDLCIRYSSRSQEEVMTIHKILPSHEKKANVRVVAGVMKEKKKAHKRQTKGKMLGPVKTTKKAHSAVKKLKKAVKLVDTAKKTTCPLLAACQDATCIHQHFKATTVHGTVSKWFPDRGYGFASVAGGFSFFSPMPPIIHATFAF